MFYEISLSATGIKPAIFDKIKRSYDAENITSKFEISSFFMLKISSLVGKSVNFFHFKPSVLTKIIEIADIWLSEFRLALALIKGLFLFLTQIELLSPVFWDSLWAATIPSANLFQNIILYSM